MEEMSKEEIENKSRKVREMFGVVEGLIGRAAERDKIRLEARGKILDKEKAILNLGDFRLGNLIRREHQKSGGDSRRFIGNLKLRVNEIGEYDQGLAGSVMRIQFNEDEINYLSMLHGHLTNYNENQLRFYFTSQGTKLVIALRDYNENDAARIVEEIMYLERYLLEVFKWQELTSTQRIQYFTERLLFYIKGHQDASSGIDYRGILTYFKDKKLMKAILESDELKRPLTYARLRSIFSSLLAKASKGIREEDWGDFEDFWKHRRKYERLIERLGYVGFGESLKKEVKHIKQDPQTWISQFQDDIKTIDNPNYINNRIVIPASRELIGLFERRILELISELEKKLAGRVEELQRRPDEFSKSIIKNINLRERKTRRNLNRIRKNFEKRERRIVAAMVELVLQKERMYETFNFSGTMDYFKRWGDYSEKAASLNLQLSTGLNGYRLANYGIPVMLLSALSTLSHSLEMQDKGVEKLSQNLLDANVDDIKSEIIKSVEKIDNMQNGLDEFLSKIGIWRRNAERKVG